MATKQSNTKSPTKSSPRPNRGIGSAGPKRPGGSGGRYQYGAGGKRS